MAPIRVASTYKKQNGFLTISKDKSSVSWTPSSPRDAVASLIISVANVTNLQQTPESSAKVMLKIFAQNPGQSEPLAHVFTFTSKDARAEANAIKEELASLIQAHKTAQNTASSSVSQSAAMTIANAISGKNSWEDDEKLKSDTNLCTSLLEEDPNLNKTFQEGLSSKPPSMSHIQFTSQFWSSRIHLLRAHAISHGQGRGKYNVFSEIDPKNTDKKLNLTQDMVTAIFEQYPVMIRVYNEVQGPGKAIATEPEFWARFFQSRLYSSLRGMKIDERMEIDPNLDKYLDAPELTGLRPTPPELHIPRFIDLEGNEENHSQRKGNRPDAELRQTALDKAPVIRKLNAISEKLMATVHPSDTDASQPIGMDEAEYEALRLRDLSGDKQQDRIILNIRDQSRFFSSEETSKEPQNNLFASLNPAAAIRSVCKDITTTFPHPGQGVIPIAPFEAIDLDDSSDISSGSKTATKHILSLIQTHRSQTAPIPPTSGLSEQIYPRLTLTHATTLEFLRQFWSAFLSGDSSRANDIVVLVESLNASIDRINAIAKDAGDRRSKEVRRAEKQAEELYRTTGKRRKVNYAGIEQGSERVMELCGPLVEGLGRAVGEYKREFELQMKELEVVGGAVGGTPAPGTPVAA